MKNLRTLEGEVGVEGLQAKENPAAPSTIKNDVGKMVTYGEDLVTTFNEAEASVPELKTPEEREALRQEKPRQRTERSSRPARLNPRKYVPKVKVMGEKDPAKEETPEERAEREKQEHDQMLENVQSFDMSPYKQLGEGHGTFVMDRFDTIVAATNDISYSAQIMSESWEPLFTGSTASVAFLVQDHISHLLLVVADKDPLVPNIARYRGVLRFPATAVRKLTIAEYNGHKTYTEKVEDNK
ncbi:hypothetical protein RBB50_010295 [Rhinocladiella similis]